MSRRVALGKLGTDSSIAKYGFRVSKTGADAVPAASTSATVATSDLIFDSLNGVGSLSVYKVFLVEDIPAWSPPTSVTQNSNVGMGIPLPTGVVQSFGETLSGIPYTIAQRVISSTQQETYRFSSSVVGNTRSGTPLAYVASFGPADTGWYTITTNSQITIYNYETSTIDVRIALFNFFI